jgi:DNA-directed RNA polymerase subunit RPC12/RpoP
MNLTKCEECGYEITVKTNTCINCGEKIGKLKPGRIKIFLRSIIYLLIAAYILLSALKFIK